MRPLVSVVIPTRGRATLTRALASIRSQADPSLAEIIVVADTHGDPLLCDVEVITREFGARYLEHDAGGHFTGHPQIDHGFRHAQGRYLLALGDDDEYVADGLDVVTEAIEAHGRPAPFMFKVELRPSPSRRMWAPMVIWDDRGLERGAITSQNLVVPRIGKPLPPYWDDAAFIFQTVKAWGEQSVVWRDEIIARCY